MKKKRDVKKDEEQQVEDSRWAGGVSEYVRQQNL